MVRGEVKSSSDRVVVPSSVRLSIIYSYAAPLLISREFEWAHQLGWLDEEAVEGKTKRDLPAMIIDVRDDETPRRIDAGGWRCVTCVHWLVIFVASVFRAFATGTSAHATFHGP